MLTPALPHDGTETDSLRLAAARGRRLLAVYRRDVLPLKRRKCADHETAISIVADILAWAVESGPWPHWVYEQADQRLESLLDAAVSDAERLDERRMDGGR